MNFYKTLIRPLLFKLPTETAHELGLKTLHFGLGSEILRNKIGKELACDEFGELKRFGLTFKNPFGIAAGFDKNAIVARQLAALGFGFIEVGTVTFHPQPGNEKPRLFRLPEDRALINRAGFNNEGTAKLVERLKKSRPACVVGVNIGKSKIVPVEEAAEDYLKSFELAHEVADYIAVNVSSPNTPNLRELQKAESLEKLLSALQKRNREKSAKPLLLKIAPDLSESEIEAIAGICLKLNLAGIIATNTTISRENLKTDERKVEKIGAGGLSGKPLRENSSEVIRKIYKYSKGKLPIIGVGGIFTAEDAFEKIASGACLIQAYTGFVYQGVTFARDINSGLAKILREKGFPTLDEAVGSDLS
ncbi:MAG: quinone-dependent dihydroorotate dehydrogenase [Pyrinomonadaceae bacterium]